MPGISILKLTAAVAASLAAAGIRYVCVTYFGIGTPLLILHVAAIAFVSQYLGTLPGLLTTAASFALILYQLTPAPDPVTLVLFLVLGTALCLFGGKRLRTAQQARRTRYNLETAQHIANIGSWESDLVENIWWSPETYNIFGIPPGTALHTRDFYELVHPEDRAAVQQAVKKAVRAGADYDIEHRIVRKSDGQLRYVHQRAKLIRDHTVHLIGSIQDITSQRKARDELERLNRTMSLALDAGKSGAWVWDLETGELSWSDTYYRLLGVDPSVKPTPEFFRSLVHPDDRNGLMKSLEDAAAGRLQEFRTEFRIQSADGFRWFERRGRVFCNSDGRPGQLVGITTDITERKILRGMLPACAQCKKIKDEHDHWQVLEKYISEHSDARFSHGLCPECRDEWMKAEGLQGA